MMGTVNDQPQSALTYIYFFFAMLCREFKKGSATIKYDLQGETCVKCKTRRAHVRAASSNKAGRLLRAGDHDVSGKIAPKEWQSQSESCSIPTLTCARISHIVKVKPASAAAKGLCSTGYQNYTLQTFKYITPTSEVNHPGGIHEESFFFVAAHILSIISQF